MEKYPIEVTYNGVVDRYRKTDYFCPNCGSKDSVYEEQGEDYYVGHCYICITCSIPAYIIVGRHPLEPWQEEAIRVIKQSIGGI